MSQKDPGRFRSAPGEAAATEELPDRQFAAGQVLGGRYEIRRLLGSGGMGEVWQALDLKLRVEVALKTIRPDRLTGADRIEELRREVRAARQVVSPNVCRIFDLVEVDGLEMVSMEYVDGTTLLHVLQQEGPLDLNSAQDVAAQFLAGLEAIHAADLVHRDVKPENIMLTRSGRVVVMDFGLALRGAEGTNVAAGTPAYMAPEQARGDVVDARADVYSVGVILAEMVSPEGIQDLRSRQSIWEGIRQEPVRIPDSPWKHVIERAVAREPESRQHSAHTLIRELEEVTTRLRGDDEKNPFPGLAAFTENDAEYFYGREREVEALWQTLGLPHLLAVIGPSGAGKSSFIHAGLIPACPEGWSVLVATPGNAPFVLLARALVPQFTTDTDALRNLVGTADEDAIASAITEWRSRHDHALLVIDQFEELFTLCSPHLQRSFADFLGQLAVDTDLHVLVVMRDDFLFHCQGHESLRPVFSEITPLGPLVGGALRRALVRPASTCGYRFEDDHLVEEMLADVEGERGSLPLLAFAAHRLWLERDRDKGELSREAYERIGGVAGALAQHAEEVFEEIGAGHEPVVREVFRNLIAAQGTRAVCDYDELLSVFPENNRGQATEVLRKLVDARLLTTFEMEEGNESTRHVEIVHESLLSAWPRLVRWRTQDAGAAQLRDQLHQAARTWDEHDRSDDLLWIGTAYREYRVWRERYAGGLTDLEEAFATAMTSLATRRRRRRRIAVAAVFAALLLVLAVVGRSRQQAVASAKRAEASKLVTLGQTVLDSQRTVALAYALASLERADNGEARRLAVRALWAGPPTTILPEGSNAWGLGFSDDGQMLAVGHVFGSHQGKVQVYRRDGSDPVRLQGFEGKGNVRFLRFSPNGQRLIGSVWGPSEDVRIWNTSDWAEERVLHHPGVRWAGGDFAPDGRSILTYSGVDFAAEDEEGLRHGRVELRRWLDGSGESELIGSLAAAVPPSMQMLPNRNLFLASDGKVVRAFQLDTLGQEPGRVIARSEIGFGWGLPVLDSTGENLLLTDPHGTLQLWALEGDGSSPVWEIDSPAGPSAGAAFSPDGSLLARAGGGVGSAYLWDLRGPVGAEPLRFANESDWYTPEVAFTPDGHRLVVSWAGNWGLGMWPLTDRYCRVLRGHEGGAVSIDFSPDGKWLFSMGLRDGRVLAWNLEGGAGAEPDVIFQTRPVHGWGLRVEPHGRFLVCSFDSGAWKVPLDGSVVTPLGDFPELRAVFHPSGRLVAAAQFAQGGHPLVGVLDLESGRRWDLTEPGDGDVSDWSFDPQGRLLIVRGRTLSRWDPETETTEILVEDGVLAARAIGDGRRHYLYVEEDEGDRHFVRDLETGETTELPLDRPQSFFADSPPEFIDWDDTGTLMVYGDPANGDITVRTLDDEDPHLLLGHGLVTVFPRLSPDGRWIASFSDDPEIRLWPVPDFTKQPLHTLPYDELIAKLKEVTNLRVVPDDTSHTGYAVEPDFTAYRGWAEVPDW